MSPPHQPRGARPEGTPLTVWAEKGRFALSDGSLGNPGCDECGEADAVVRHEGRYLCAEAARVAGVTHECGGPCSVDRAGTVRHLGEDGGPSPDHVPDIDRA